MMAEATAWIVDLAYGLRAAVGERDMVHLVEKPTWATIPYTPSHCRRVLLWENELLPIIDLTMWLIGQSAEDANPSSGIVAWQEQPEATPQYGVLLFSGLPRKVRVTDAQRCALPAQPSGWPTVAISCFRYHEQPVPILDLPRIFSGALT
jgi:hypothetical protein